MHFEILFHATPRNAQTNESVSTEQLKESLDWINIEHHFFISVRLDPPSLFSFISSMAIISFPLWPWQPATHKPNTRSCRWEQIIHWITTFLGFCFLGVAKQEFI